MEKGKTTKKRGRLKKAVKKESPPKKAKKPSKEKKPAKSRVKPKTEKYFEGIGRRKTAVARVRIFLQKKKPSKPGGEEGNFLVGKKRLEEYFPRKDLQQTIIAPLELMSASNNFRVSAKVKGGGLVSQAEAVRHGLARALVLFNASFRKKLKKAGYLKRDPRMRERKKFGLKRARRAPQWRKR